MKFSSRQTWGSRHFRWWPCHSSDPQPSTASPSAGQSSCRRSWTPAPPPVKRLSFFFSNHDTSHSMYQWEDFWTSHFKHLYLRRNTWSTSTLCCMWMDKKMFGLLISNISRRFLDFAYQTPLLKEEYLIDFHPVLHVNGVLVGSGHRHPHHHHHCQLPQHLLCNLWNIATGSNHFYHFWQQPQLNPHPHPRTCLLTPLLSPASATSTRALVLSSLRCWGYLYFTVLSAPFS